MDTGRRALVAAQLKYTQALVERTKPAGKFSVFHSDVNALHDALQLSADLVNEMQGGRFIDRANMRDGYTRDALCPELQEKLS